jgi:hypothetical protein
MANQPAPKYPLAEVFGFSTLDMSMNAIRHRKMRLCPFNNKGPNCTKAGAQNVILVIDDISKEIKQYLIDMKVQSISKQEVLKLAANFDESEDRQKVLRIVYEEFRREYSSRIK